MKKFELIQEFNQAEHFPNTDGVCAALSMQWIARSARRSSFWNYVESRGGKDHTVELQKKQEDTTDAARRWREKFEGYKARGNALRSREDMLTYQREGQALYLEQQELLSSDPAALRKKYIEENCQLSRVGDPVSYEAKDTKALLQDLNTFSGYALIGTFWQDKETGHAIAVYLGTDMNEIRIMDPNHGECSIGDKTHGLTGLRDHIFQRIKDKPVERVRIEFYPATPAQAPARPERAFAAAIGEPASEAPSMSEEPSISDLLAQFNDDGTIKDRASGGEQSSGDKH